MVSTRQMATSSSNAANSGEETARLTVVTRQTNYNNNVFANCSTIATSSHTTGQRGLSGGGGGGGGSSSASSSTSTTSRQTHSTQAFKAHHNATSGAVVPSVSPNIAAGPVGASLNLQDLPTEVLSNILSYVGYKKIGQLRVVSHKVNDVCMHILNSTFSKLITKTFNRFQAIKANMPRRESARRNHPLACECDIIETCYMRLSLLQMTFGKHIERGHCCFFPGAILDEVYTILHYIKNTPCLERPYRVTDELFDLSTMAMEYFRDHIEPTLPGIAYFNKDFFKLPSTTKRPALVIASDLSDSPASLPSPPQSNMVLRKGIRKIKQGMKIYNNQLSVLRNELRTCKRKSFEQGKQIAEQQKILAEQRKQTLEYANRLDENDKKNEEMSRKFSTLLQELNKCKTELQYWRSKSPAIPTCTSCGQKVPPVLPPEDYQALINQGVKPEDIILNLNDDTDAESDVSTNEGHGDNLTLCTEFVFPDEATTAKLMAVNTAAKNLKRQHSGNINTTTTTTTTTSTVNTSNNRNTNDFIGGGGLTNSLDLNISLAASSNSTAQAADGAANGAGAGAGAASLPTKLFYGAANNGHKSVIVAPHSVRMNAAAATSICSYAHNSVNDPSNTVDNVVADGGGGNGSSSGSGGGGGGGGGSGNGGGGGGGGNVEDVVSLQAITSHEAKKARRVQKASRCANTGGKRK